MLFSRKAVFTLAALILFGCLFSPTEVRADDIVITGGYVFIGGAPRSSDAWSEVAFNFSGDGFAAGGSAIDSATQGIMSPCAFDPCQPGTTVFPNSRAFLDGVGGATFNGTTVSAWWLQTDSRLSFTGPGVSIPNATDEFVTVTTPFTMTGSVFVHTLDDINHPVIFSTTISGSGLATLRFQFFPDSGPAVPGGYIYSGVRYDFEPVPEPATLSLLGLGVAGLAAHYRRRRHSLSK